MRTTITIDASIIKKIRDIAHQESKPLTKVIEKLLKIGLEFKDNHQVKRKVSLRLHTKKLGSKIDLSDKEALYNILDGI